MILPKLHITRGCVEEPELYQHPNRQRHLSKILMKLAMGGIQGVAEHTQVLYSTHSPLFVDIKRFEHVRALRKETRVDDKPKETRVLRTTLDEIAKVVEEADGKPKGTYTGKTLEPRLQALMTPWMNEGFFADAAVLVEGEEDRAAILGAAAALGYDLESMGVSVIPCMGKNNIDRPTAIFRNLQIPVYAIWDSDHGDADAKPEENHRLLRLFGESIEDWPERVSNQFACFKQTLKDTLRNEVGQELFDEVFDSCRERLCLGKKKHAHKNPMVVRKIIDEANGRSKPSETLNEIVSRVVALKS